MGKIIHLKQADSPMFQSLMADTLKRLEDAGDMLVEDVLNLAMLGPWKQWSDEQPVGACLPFDSMEALKETGDPRLTTMYSLYENIQHVLHTIRGGGHGG